jgi:hypothetical protein
MILIAGSMTCVGEADRRAGGAGVTGYPAVEVMTLVETGTRALLGAVSGPPATGETDYARELLHLLGPDMLVLADRGFDAAAFLAEIAATGAAFAALTGRIGRAVLDGLLPPRRPRVSVRKVKSPLSRWNKADPHRPRHSTPVTARTITVSNPDTTTQSATHRDQCLTAMPGP